MPTTSTPWFNITLPQLVNTPYWYGAQFVASTATDIGELNKACVNAGQPKVALKEDILKEPWLYLQIPLTPT
jgi:hypothetical protein